MVSQRGHLGERSLANHNVLVWGASGFIGQHLVRELLRREARVSVLVRPRARAVEPEWSSRVQWFEFPSTGRAQNVFRQALSSASIVYDLAGKSGAVASNRDPARDLDENCRAHLDFLDECGHPDRRPHVVFASSRLVYGRPGIEPVDELRTVSPMSIYAAHKLCIEHYLQIFARQGRISYTICRISNVFDLDWKSTTRSHGFMNSLIVRSLAGEAMRLYGGGRQVRDYIHISDLVEALLLCGTAAAARNEIFNIGSGHGIRIRDAATYILQLTGGPPIVEEPWPHEYELVESGDYVSDIGKARSVLGFSPQFDFYSGLRKTLAVLAPPTALRAAAGSGANATQEQSAPALLPMGDL